MMENPGQRLRYLRNHLLKLPLSVIARKYGLDRQQIYNWESGRVKVTQMVLNTYIPCLEKEGIKVEHSWVLNGIGLLPSKLTIGEEVKPTYYPITTGETPEPVLMAKDVSSFLSNHPNPICTFVDSNYMYPLYKKGDYVCGKILFHFEEIASKLVGRDCIIFTKSNNPFIRRILSVNPDKSFNLIGISDIDASKMENIIIDSAAEIILHRKLTYNI